MGTSKADGVRAFSEVIGMCIVLGLGINSRGVYRLSFSGFCSDWLRWIAMKAVVL